MLSIEKGSVEEEVMSSDIILCLSITGIKVPGTYLGEVPYLQVTLLRGIAH